MTRATTVPVATVGGGDRGGRKHAARRIPDHAADLARVDLTEGRSRRHRPQHREEAWNVNRTRRGGPCGSWSGLGQAPAESHEHSRRREGDTTELLRSSFDRVSTSLDFFHEIRKGAERRSSARRD